MDNTKKVLLIDPPFRDIAFGSRWQLSPRLAPPLGLMYLATPILKAGFEVDFIDLNIERFSKEQFLIKVIQADFIGFTCYNESLNNVLRLIKIIRQANPRVFILCGGPYCTMSEKYVRGSDLTAIGEAEEYIAEILTQLVKKKSLANIPGIIYKKEGKLIRSQGVMKVENLDLNYPSFLELAKDKNYGYYLGVKLDNIMGIITSRGCPFSCRFCVCKGRLPYRERSAENVVEEIKKLSKQRFRYLVFYDNNFLLNKKRARQIMERLIEENIRVKIVIQGRVDSADLVLYQKLRQGGVMIIMYGIESANQNVLDFYNKRVKLEQIKKAVSLCNKEGIFSYGWIIIGAPMETEEHFRKDIQFFNEIKLDFMFLGPLEYSVGSGLWQEAFQKGLIKENEIMVRANKKLSNFSTQQIFAIKERMNRKFYLNLARLLRIVFKFWKLKEIPLMIKFILEGNKDLVQWINNPFKIQKIQKKVVVNESFAN